MKLKSAIYLRQIYEAPKRKSRVGQLHTLCGESETNEIKWQFYAWRIGTESFCGDTYGHSRNYARSLCSNFHEIPVGRVCLSCHV